MQSLVELGSKKKRTLVDPLAGKQLNVLSESEEEHFGDPAASGSAAHGSGDPMQMALSRLTEIAGALASDKLKKSASSKLEAALGEL